MLESPIPKEQLLAEVEALIRIAPPKETLRHPTSENLSWLGRVSAVIERWNSPKSIAIGSLQAQLRQAKRDWDTGEAYFGIMTLLHQARTDLLLSTAGPMSVSVSQGMPFDYFDEIRKVIETARQDIFFIDPYLDAEFVSRYLSHVSKGTSVRLLAEKKLPSLLPAVDMFAKQHQLKIEVRSSPSFHDRYLFIDQQACYHSGASFKDGAKTSPTTVNQITDAFQGVLQIYEDLWSKAKVERQ